MREGTLSCKMNKTKNKKKSKADTATIEFSAYAQVTLVSGANNLALNPANYTRLSSIGDAYEFYRLKRLKFRIHPGSSLGSDQVVAFLAGVIDTPPSTVAQASEVVNSTILALSATVPSSWVDVPEMDLRGSFPWYKTVQGTSDTAEEVVGYLFCTGGTTNIVKLEIRGQFEFKEAVAPANTPLAIELRKKIREERARLASEKERENLLKVISLGATAITQGKV